VSPDTDVLLLLVGLLPGEYKTGKDTKKQKMDIFNRIQFHKICDIYCQGLIDQLLFGGLTGEDSLQESSKDLIKLYDDDDDDGDDDNVKLQVFTVSSLLKVTFLMHFVYRTMFSSSTGQTTLPSHRNFFGQDLQW